MSRLQVVSIGMAVIACCAAAASAHAEPALVAWHDGLLSVHASQADRRTVLRDVTRLTGAPIGGLEHVSDTVTIELTDVPLRAALMALVDEFGYALTESGRADLGEPVQYDVQINGPRPPLAGPTRRPGRPGPPVDGPAAAPPTVPAPQAARPPGPPASSPGMPPASRADD